MANVLLLEADQLLAGNVKRFLEHAGHEVNWQAEPQTAIHAADTQKPDVVVLDLLLGVHSGAEFLYEFRSYPDWAKIPVILLSSVSGEELHESFPAIAQLNVSVCHYKPKTSLAKLAQTINDALQPAVK